MTQFLCYVTYLRIIENVLTFTLLLQSRVGFGILRKTRYRQQVSQVLELLSQLGGEDDSLLWSFEHSIGDALCRRRARMENK